MNYDVSDSSVPGRAGLIPVRDYVPERGGSGTAFLWVHSGGFTSGGLDQKESHALAKTLAASGRRVRTIDYRVAPKLGRIGKVEVGIKPGRFPAAHEHVLDVAAALEAETGGDISIGGASAGANIVAGAALALRDASARQPRALMLAYGTFHADLPHRPEVERDLRGPLARWAFNPKMTRRMNLNYVGDERLLVPGHAFPGGADLRGLAPTLLVNYRNDRLRSSGETFTDELERAGVEVARDTMASSHAFLNAPDTDAYRVGMAAITAWLQRHD